MRRLVLLALLVPLVAGCGWWLPSERLAVDPVSQVPYWVKAERLPANAVPGAQLFSRAGCLACHVYAGSGGQELNAPNLTAIGTHHLGIAFEIAHLKCPSCAVPGSPMPPFASLGAKRLHELAIFLEASKGVK